MGPENYDVAIIGAGLGGLAAATLLSKAGYKTLVAEKLPFVGGRASSMEYKGFRLTTGAIGIEMGGVVQELFNEVGADFNIRPHPTIWYRIKGKDNPLPQKGGLRGLVTLASSAEESDKVMAAIRRAFRWQEPSDSGSLKEWLLQYTQNEHVLGVFGTIASNIEGANLDEMPAGEFIRFLKIGFRDAGFHPQGNAALMNSLGKVFQARGGTLWTRSRTKSIVIEGGKATGIVVEREGKEVKVGARVVISAAGPRKTLELAGENHFDVGYLRTFRETLRGGNFIWIVATSNRPLIDHPGGLVLTQSKRITLLEQPTHVCPEWAPPGKHLLLAGGSLKSSYLPTNLDEEIKLSIQDVRDNVPGFDRDAEILMVSTFHRGWPCFYGAPGHRVSFKTPVENLYNAGDGVTVIGPSGLPATVRSARLVVEDVKARFKPGG